MFLVEYSKGPATPGKTAELDDVSKRLLRAAEIIRERGWCQGTRQNARGEFCIRGALLYVLYGSVRPHVETNDPSCDYQRYARPLKQSLGVDINHGAGEVVWNDTQGRTKEQVIAALENAALHRVEDAASHA